MTGDQERSLLENSLTGALIGQPLSPGDAGDDFLMAIEAGNSAGLFRLEACTG